MLQTKMAGHRLWCPRCEQHVEMARVQTAARLTNLHGRTLYRYIEMGLLHTVKVAGGGLRVCPACVVKAAARRTRGIVLTQDQAWCLKCNKSVTLLSTSEAARSAEISKRTLRRYIHDQRVSVAKGPGPAIRLCAGCLLKMGSAD